MALTAEAPVPVEQPVMKTSLLVREPSMRYSSIEDLHACWTGTRTGPAVFLILVHLP